MTDRWESGVHRRGVIRDLEVGQTAYSEAEVAEDKAELTDGTVLLHRFQRPCPAETAFGRSG